MDVTRLAVLLTGLVSEHVAAHSSDAPRTLPDAFRARKLDVLVCSALVARGATCRASEPCWTMTRGRCSSRRERAAGMGVGEDGKVNKV